MANGHGSIFGVTMVRLCRVHGVCDTVPITPKRSLDRTRPPPAPAEVVAAVGLAGGGPYDFLHVATAQFTVWHFGRGVVRGHQVEPGR